MIVRLSVTHPRLGPYVVYLPCYQWKYTDGAEAQLRDLGTTAAGVHYEDPLNVQKRFRAMRFVLTDDLANQLRTLAIFAHRFVRDVRFWPAYDDDPDTYWDLDWETDTRFSQVLDSRQEVELLAAEKGPATASTSGGGGGGGGGAGAGSGDGGGSGGVDVGGSGPAVPITRAVWTPVHVVDVVIAQLLSAGVPVPTTERGPQPSITCP